MNSFRLKIPTQPIVAERVLLVCILILLQKNIATNLLNTVNNARDAFKYDLKLRNKSDVIDYSFMQVQYEIIHSARIYIFQIVNK